MSRRPTRAIYEKSILEAAAAATVAVAVAVAVDVKSQASVDAIAC